MFSERLEKSERSEKLWERSVDQKERLVQTYTVLYGLLISFGQNEPLQVAQSAVVEGFFPFLILILVYYTLLSRLTYDGMFDDSPWYVKAGLSFLIFAGLNISTF